MKYHDPTICHWSISQHDTQQNVPSEPHTISIKGCFQNHKNMKTQTIFRLAPNKRSKKIYGKLGRNTENYLMMLAREAEINIPWGYQT